MRRYCTVLPVVWGILTAIAGVAQSGGLTERIACDDRAAVVEFNLCCTNQGDALRFRFSDPQSYRSVELVTGEEGTRLRFEPVDLFPADMRQMALTFPAPLLITAVESNLWFTLKRTPDNWIAYVNHQAVACLPELWQGRVEVGHCAALMPAAADEESYAQRLGSFRFEDNFMIPEGTEFPLTWEVMSGNWSLHSVTGDISGRVGSRKLSRQPKPEKSPNFYAMTGSGTNAVVLAGESFYSHYLYRCAVQHNCGTNGLVFMADESGGFYAFTVRTDAESNYVVMDLWQHSNREDTVPRILDTVLTELPIGQWLLLEVQLYDACIICRADNIEVIRRKVMLPPGGRFGLFCSTPAEESTRFDDVVAHTHQDRRFDSPADVRWQTREQPEGMCSVLREGVTWVYMPPADTATNHWSYGSELDGNLRQQTEFIATSTDFVCGLSVGTISTNTSQLRFTCVQEQGRRLCVLSECLADTTQVLDTHELAFSSNRVTLALDALRPHELRCYVDGSLVCFDRQRASAATGVLGVFTAAHSDMFFTAPQVLSRDMTLSERFEKNPLYVNDLFMRHWSSPEGQWITLQDGMTWFKGDITGAVKVRLPVVDKMELHLGVPEGSTNGVITVSIREDTLQLHVADSNEAPVCNLPVTKIPEVQVGDQKVKIFTVGLEGQVVWIGGDEELLTHLHLKEPMHGGRLRIAGMSVDNLKHTLVKRDNVFDTLFNESLYNWTINGGKWEVVNRFSCEPTWSHMNGESEDSLAALWSKYIFSGDFCIEFYAGMRMGWYQRAGDLNLTIMSRYNATCDGYTAIATGWDPDHSQLYSRILRNGELMDISTKYLVPRVREGMYRAGFQPLVHKGRDMHGAWYGINLRRTGNKLQYIYDNEEVFDLVDENPLQDGSLGIWTYRNSMMVARIKIAAESIKPRPFKFTAVEPGYMSDMHYPAPLQEQLRVNGRSVQPLVPEYWHASDTVSCPNLNFRNLGTNKPEMHVVSTLGGGTFLVHCDLPPIQPDKILGWQFEVARHPQAQFNFEFVTMDTNHNKVVEEFSYVLSGSDEKRGGRRIIGKLKEFEPTAPSQEIRWTPVEVWIPAEIMRGKHLVKIEGFGNLQPSDIQQGLSGNPPHAWYAVRSFREIHCGVPQVSGAPEQRNEIGELNSAISKMPPGKLQMFEVASVLDKRKPILEWAVPELANFGLHAVSDPFIAGSILVTPDHPWYSSLLPPKRALADTIPAPFTMEGNAVRVLVPLDVLKPGHMTLALELADGRVFRQAVEMQSRAVSDAPPRLLNLQMLQGGIETFEARPYDTLPHKHNTEVALDYSDFERGGVLRFANSGGNYQRLTGLLVPKFDTTATPLLQFRYKGDPMARISLSHGQWNIFTFAEKYGTWVRNHEDLKPVLDDQWHVWTGMPMDTGGKHTLAGFGSVPLAPIRIGSRMSRNQTGRHSAICFDDVACGPATGPNRPFAFKADYADPLGVAEVVYAISTGFTAYDNLSTGQQEQLRWLPAGNSMVIEPDVAEIADGVHHLVVKAKNRAGVWSHPADIPFVMDRKPPIVSYKILPSELYNGSCVQVVIKDSVAPPVFNSLHLLCRGDRLRLKRDNGTVDFGQGVINLELDWIWLLRQQLATAQHGDVLPMTLAGISDAAGNVAEPCRIDIKLDLDSDQRPPTVMPFKSPENIFLMEPGLKTFKPFFSESTHIKESSGASDDGKVLTIIPNESGQTMIRKNFSPVWDPDKFPYLAISFRTLETPPGITPFNIALNTGERRPRGIKDAHTVNFKLEESLQHVTGGLSLKPGVWSDIVINVRDFLRAASTEGKETPDLTYMTLYFTNKTRQKQVQIRALAILDNWLPDHLLPLRAYDLSGVKGLVWEGGSSELTGIKPANLKLAEENQLWFKFKFSDNKDNLSDLWMIPLLLKSGSNPAGASAFEKVE